MKNWMRLMIAALVVASCSVAVHAGIVDMDGARAIATDFLSQRHEGIRMNAPKTDVSLSYTRFSSVSPTVPVFYVFNDENNGGWVIVAADDRAEQILGYNMTGNIDMDAIPCNMRAWLDEYGCQIEYLQQHPSLETKNGKRATRTDIADIDPLISTTWDQSSPYNTECPKISNKYPYTGCTATALAQVMNYYQYPTSACLPIPSYVTKTNALSVPALPETTFDWSNMLDSYDASYTTANKTAVATLMRYCGQALCMDYGLSSSSAYLELIPYVLARYFGYDRTAPSRVVSREYYDDDTWIQMLCDELSQGRPLPYTGNNGSGGGHTFIVDGYSDGSFHVNWGWNGKYNGFFQLSAFTPPNHDYTQGHKAVFGIFPDCADVNNDGKVSISDVSDLINMLLNGTSSTSPQAGDINHDGKVTINDVTALIGRLLNSSDVAGVVETYTVNGVSFDMVMVEGGTFSMGATASQTGEAASNESPVHQVTLSSFYIGKTEVTQELWQAVMGSNPCAIRGVTLPVYSVSWDDCQQFIANLNALTGKQFRLPTEAQWEFAARGGVKGHDYKYAGSDDVGAVAWYDENAVSSFTMEVGLKAPNELGLYDMSGNVFEWCDTYWHGYTSAAQTDPQGPSTGTYRVYRGGSWYTESSRCRVSSRGGGTPDKTSTIIGLRLAL